MYYTSVYLFHVRSKLAKLTQGGARSYQPKTINSGCNRGPGGWTAGLYPGSHMDLGCQDGDLSSRLRSAEQMEASKRRSVFLR